MTQQLFEGAVEGEVIEELPVDVALTEGQIEDAVEAAFNNVMQEVFSFRFRFNRRSLTLPQRMEKEAFLVFGYFLRWMADGIQFWAGDWYRYGDARWGDEIVQVLGVKHKTLVNWAWVCGKVAPEDRRTDIDFGHHPEVASLEPKEQREILAEAAENDYSVRQTRERVESIKQENAEREAVARGQTVLKIEAPAVCSRCHGTGEEPPEPVL